MNIKRFKNDVRGAALVYVIVAAAIIILLGAATTATAYVNLRATQIQEQSDNNFYSADAVMNSIVSGLESDMSKAYEIAYTKVITKINTYDDIGAAENDFNTMFVNELSNLLNDGVLPSSGFYSTAHLTNYVQTVYSDDIRYTVTALNGNNHLDTTEEGIILRNLHVTYEDDSGYYDEITTDIKLAIPQFDPEFIQPPKFQLNAFVVDDGLEINFQNGLQINGDAYINERESDHSAILLNAQTGLTIVTPNELIAGGQIKTNENTSLIFRGKDDLTTGNIIWTENFDLGRYTEANVSGQTFVYDDMEINGSYSDVRLAGEYYGYNKSETDADESSSISVNGASTKLDIRDLDMLILAGSSYVSTSTVDSGDGRYENANDIQSGEALNVKSNQIAYLVDDKEFSRDDVSNFISNPMSYTQYETMVSKNGGWNNTVGKLLGKTLSYGKSYAQYGASIVPVFSSKDGGTVYLYLSFTNTDKASAFFLDVYRGNSLMSLRLRTYAAQYLSNLQLSSNTSLLVNQNYIDHSVALYTKENIEQSGLGYDQAKPNQDSMTNLMQQYRVQYLGDGTPSGDGEKYKVMFAKLINYDKFQAFIAGATTAGTYTDHQTNNKITVVNNGVIIEGTTGHKAVIIDNKGKEIYELGNGSGLAVISGDVKITGDWLGTIIIGGRAYCTEGSKVAPIDITVDDAAVSNVLPLYFTMKSGDTETSMSVINMFKGYENLSVNNATNNEGINADMISNCITFTNWNKD